MNVTIDPAHILVEGVEIFTPAVSKEETVMVIEFDVAGLPVAQVALEVSSQVITSLSLMEELVKRSLLVPTGKPFKNHW